MRRFWLLLGLLVLLAPAPGLAQQAVRVQCKNTGSGAWQDCNGSTDSGLAVAATVNVTTSGFDSGPVQVTSPTLNAGSYSAGMSLGGLFSVAIARTNGGSGGLALIGYKSTAGSTGQVVFRIWQKNPAGTTCTDHTAFVGSATDDAQLLIAPFALTPAAPAVTTGDAATYAVLLPGRLSFVNSDTSPGKNLYVCVLTVATDTADESSTVAVRLSGDLN